jgi:hypothetical protein
MYLYYPTHWSGCNPQHQVRDWQKVRSLIRAAMRGDNIPPILIDGSLGNGNLLTGTHRAAANDIMLLLSERDGRARPLIGWVSYDSSTASPELVAAVEAGDTEAVDELVDRVFEIERSGK